jgi:hypothetical protein
MSRDLPEKLTASQPVTKSPKIHYSVYRSPPPAPFLIQINNGTCIGSKSDLCWNIPEERLGFDRSIILKYVLAKKV